jgi:hypothetical protein
MSPIQVLRPEDVLAGRGASPAEFNLQFLAQGDSWFSIGALPPMLTSNLFDGMRTTIAACAVNCARPGAELAHMTDTMSARVFLNFLNGVQSRNWSGLLLSGGGNDLVDAIGSPPESPPDRRILATRTEWTNAPGAERYLSNAGWQTFADHLQAVFTNLLAQRDRGINRGLPIFVHTYDITSPRPAPAGPGEGPWLQPAMVAYGIPPDDWISLAGVLLGRLGTLLDHIAATTADGSIHVVHTQGTLQPAPIDDAGPTTDWENEIHPTVRGYDRLGALWGPVIDAVFSGQVGAMTSEAAAAAVQAIDRMVTGGATGDGVAR